MELICSALTPTPVAESIRRQIEEKEAETKSEGWRAYFLPNRTGTTIRTTKNVIRRGEKGMAVFIKKPWNATALVFPTGCGVRVHGKVLTVVDVDGTHLGRFLANAVENYWIEDSPRSLPPGQTA